MQVPAVVADALRKGDLAGSAEAAALGEPSAEARHLDSIFTQLQLRALQVPCVRSCRPGAWETAAEFCAEAFDEQLAEPLKAIEDTDALGLASMESEAAPPTVVCACLNVVAAWPLPTGRSTLLDPSGRLLLSVQMHAQSPLWPRPVLYIPTLDDDLIIIVFPGGNPSAAEVADVLRTNEAVESSAVTYCRLPTASCRGVLVDTALRGARVKAAADGQQGLVVADVVHAVELEVSEGLAAVGALLPSGGDSAVDEASVMEVTPPFALAVWHNDLGDVGVPIAVCHALAE